MKEVLRALYQKRANIDKAIAALEADDERKPRAVRAKARARARGKAATRKIHKMRAKVKATKSRMSAAARKAQSERMRKRWAAFRREKAAKAKAA